MTLLLLLLMLMSCAAHAATYYVDPQSGSDTNNGTSTSTPWQTVPGTRTANDSGFLRTAWGSINGTTRIAPGDVIELRAGRSMTSAIGGRWQIDTNYYQDGTVGSPIVVRVSSSWGSGHFVYDMTGMTVAAFEAGIFVNNLDYVSIQGASSSRRLVVRDAPGTTTWAVLFQGSSSPHAVGNGARWMDVSSSGAFGLGFAWTDDYFVDRVRIYDSGSSGLAIGSANDQVTQRGLITDSQFYRNGFGTTGSGLAHGANLWAALDTVFLRCVSRNNRRDGFDTGTVTGTNPSSIYIVDSEAYNNGEDGFGTNGGTAGNSTVIVNSRAFGNSQAGVHVYEGAQTYIYHSILHHNGSVANGSGNIVTYNWPARRDVLVFIRNSIIYNPQTNLNVWVYSGGDNTRTPRIDSDFNIWTPNPATGDGGIGFEWPSGATATHSSPPAFIGAHDKVGAAQAPGFVSAGTASFTANNYRLAASSGSANNAGGEIHHPFGSRTPLYLSRDRDGRHRVFPPEIGAYERVTPCP